MTTSTMLLQRHCCFSPEELQSTARLAVARACVLPLKNYQFDLVTDIAQQAALHFVELLFGLPPEAHVILGEAMKASYTRLSFQIVGRHFVSDPGLLPAHSARSDQLRSDLEKFVVDAAGARQDETLAGTGVSTETVISRLYDACGRSSDEPVFVALGLMAGTIGNVTAAVAIAINHFLTGRNGQKWLVESAITAARRQSSTDLWNMIDEALAANPAAPFLARTARGPHVRFADKQFAGPIPEGAQVLLAIGADSTSAVRFGGDWNDKAFPHRCVGRCLAEPLVVETVRQILLLPGLSRVVDPDSGRPFGLEKRWGAICTKFPLQFQRDRLLNQQRLHVVLPIKEPIAENAEKLRLLTIAGAHVVEEALRKSRHVHFAWFDFAENNTHLAMSTVYDGNFDAYVEFFALEVPLFDKQFEFLADAPPLPIREHPKEFVDTIRKYDRAPLGGYFFSAYPRVGVADINATAPEAP